MLKVKHLKIHYFGYVSRCQGRFELFYQLDKILMMTDSSRVKLNWSTVTDLKVSDAKLRAGHCLNDYIFSNMHSFSMFCQNMTSSY